MKKMMILCLFFLLIASVNLLGCGGDDDPITDGDTADGDATDGDTTDGDTTDGDTTDGDTTDGDTTDGDTIDGDTTDGDTTDGDTTDGDTTDGDTTDGDTTDGDTTDGDTTDGDSTDGDTTTELTISNLIVAESTTNHLAAIVIFDTSVPTTASVAVSDGQRSSWTVDSGDELKTSHELVVLGLVSETAYSLTITVEDDLQRSISSDPQPFTTDSLPDDFPPIHLTVAATENVQPGVTLMNVERWNPANDIGYGLILAVDDQGQVVWYLRDNFLIFDVKPMDSDTLVYSYINIGFRFVDWTGEETNELISFNTGVDTFHHDIIQIPNGNYLTISTELKEISGYPPEAGKDDGETYNVVGDVIVEVTPDGTLVKSWSMFDYLDPKRTREGFHDQFWDQNYANIGTTKDWTHCNALLYDESDNSIIISCRNQDWLIKIDRDTDDLVWKLGEGGDFTMLGDGEWIYHQHAPEFLPNGNLLIYDNGNGRYSNKENVALYSRAVEYNIDEVNMTVEQVWEYLPAETPNYSPFVGDANRLENGNILVVNGGLVDDPDLHYTEPTNLKSARITEIIPGDPIQKAFELTVRDEAETDPVGYSIYRAVRIPAFHE